MSYNTQVIRRQQKETLRLNFTDEKYEIITLDVASHESSKWLFFGQINCAVYRSKNGASGTRQWAEIS